MVENRTMQNTEIFITTLVQLKPTITFHTNGYPIYTHLYSTVAGEEWHHEVIAWGICAFQQSTTLATSNIMTCYIIMSYSSTHSVVYWNISCNSITIIWMNCLCYFHVLLIIYYYCSPISHTQKLKGKASFEVYTLHWKETFLWSSLAMELLLRMYNIQIYSETTSSRNM